MADEHRTRLEKELINRTRRLRENAGFTQREVADLIGCTMEAYRKYETRSPLPAVLTGPFARLMNQRIHYIIYGCEEREPPSRPVKLDMTRKTKARVR